MSSTIELQLHGIFRSNPNPSQTLAETKVEESKAQWEWEYGKTEKYCEQMKGLASLEFPVWAIPLTPLVLLIGLLSFVFPKSIRLLGWFLRSSYCDIRTLSCWVLSWSRLTDASILEELRERICDPVIAVRLNALRALVWKRQLIKSSNLPDLPASILFDAAEKDSISDLNEQIESLLIRMGPELLPHLHQLFALELKWSSKLITFSSEVVLRRISAHVQASELVTALLRALQVGDDDKEMIARTREIAKRKLILEHIARHTLRLEKQSPLRADIGNELYLQTLSGQFPELRQDYAFLADLLSLNQTR